MDSNFSSNPNKKGSGQGHSEQGAVLVLHNDDIHTFEFVMETLEHVCDHTLTQAEQCAMITHYKGKCDIMVGGLQDLREVHRELTSRGLTVTLE